uniref:non-specific serine/threonine protein kinase n=1 Tax=Populus trichocarpa TaxID=3694 RepID=A0A3N7EN76_POPTR
MASIDYEPKLLAILSISFFLSCIFVSVAALDPALLASEGKALVESGWWSVNSNLSSLRCMWLGIVCDRAGSIIEISPPPEFLKATQPEATSSKNGDLFSIWNYDGRIAYEDIIAATENFDLRYCIGTGGYGSVYRAQLPSGKLVALKKLHRREAEEPAFDKSFKNEVELLTQIRHRSIVKLYGFCLHQRCMFLVYEYMEKGSLFCALRNDVGAVELKWMKRAHIIKDIAHALSYLHHECNPPIVHRDISSSNVLLNSESKSFVADFGVARLLDPDSSNNTVLAGTYGYIAPASELWRLKL